MSDTSALSHYSLVSVAVCRKVVISINYNYNELGSSEISLRETALKGRRTLICVGYIDSSFHDNVGKNKDEGNGIRIPGGIYGLEISDSPRQHVMIGAMPLRPSSAPDLSHRPTAHVTAHVKLRVNVKKYEFIFFSKFRRFNDNLFLTALLRSCGFLRVTCTRPLPARPTQFYRHLPLADASTLSEAQLPRCVCLPPADEFRKQTALLSKCEESTRVKTLSTSADNKPLMLERVIYPDGSNDMATLELVF